METVSCKYLGLESYLWYDSQTCPIELFCVKIVCWPGLMAWAFIIQSLGRQASQSAYLGYTVRLGVFFNMYNKVIFNAKWILFYGSRFFF